MKIINVKFVGDDQYTKLEVDDEQYNDFVDRFVVGGNQWRLFVVKPTNYLCEGLAINMENVAYITF